MTTYTMTKKELVDSVIEHLTGLLKDNVSAFLEGDLEICFFEHWQNIRAAEKAIDDKCSNLNSAIQYWCDMLSEVWFEKHPEVEDVLLLVNTAEDGVKTKTWMASK